MAQRKKRGHLFWLLFAALALGGCAGSAATIPQSAPPTPKKAEPREKPRVVSVPPTVTPAPPLPKPKPPRLAIPSTSPLQYFTVTSSFGAARSHGSHTGIDLAAASGTPIVATANGRVRFAAWRGGYGNLVDLDHGESGYRTRYAHLHTILVHQGQYVKQGDVIGTVGMTGNATGPHLHYEVLYRSAFVDPASHLSRLRE